MCQLMRNDDAAVQRWERRRVENGELIGGGEYKPAWLLASQAASSAKVYGFTLPNRHRINQVVIRWGIRVSPG